MPDLSTLALFAVAALAMLVIPGPAVLYVVTRSIDQGRLAGVVSTLGIAVGTLFHVAAAALGVSALLVSSALAFQVVKYAGALYLVFLGLRKLLASPEEGPLQIVERRRLREVFVQGILVNLLNPKTALFFLAFLPQFVDVGRGAVALQVMILGLGFVVLGFLSDSLWAVLAGSVAGWLRGNERYRRIQRIFAGGVYVALGLAAALSGPAEAESPSK